MRLRTLYCVIKQAAAGWVEDNAPTQGAALAYYAVFSLAPVLLIAISMAGLIVGEDAARSGIATEVRETLGPATADAVAALLNHTYETGDNIVATVLGLVTLLLGASGVYVQLQAALNIVWKTEAPRARGGGVMDFLRHRLLSFGAVVGTGFLLLVSLVVNSMLAAFGHWLTSGSLPGGVALWQAVSLMVTFTFITMQLALIFKVLPDAPVAWRDVWVGAVATAALFTLGQHLIGLYLGTSGVASAYGAAGSLVVVLVWVYYSAQIVLFGAEITHAFAHTCGSRVRSEPAAGNLEAGRHVTVP